MKSYTRYAATLLALLPAAIGPAIADTDPVACVEARQLLLAGELEQAERRFAGLLDAAACDGCALQGHVAVLIALDRWRQALEAAEGCHRSDPDSPRIAAAWGEALYRAGRLEQAEQILEQLESSDRAGGRALSLLGLLRLARGHGPQAVELMDRAVAAAPADRHVWVRAAEAAPSRAEAMRRIERYLELSEGDDPDRIEAARGTLRTLSALGERELWVLDERPRRVELPLQLLPRERGRVSGAVVKAAVGDKGKAVRLMLDTGSSGLFLVGRMARKRGFEELAEETAFGGGGDRRHASPRGLLPRFDIGSLSFRNALASTTENEFDPTGRFHGVLGVSIFEGYRLTLDLRRGRLILDAPPDDAAGTRYWTIAGQMLVAAGAVRGPDGLFLLDTGASLSILDLDYAGTVPGVELREGAAVHGYGGLVAGAAVARGARLTFQGFDTGGGDLRAVDLSLRSRLGGVQLAGYLGLDLLGGKRLVVDTTRRRVKVVDGD